MIVKEDTKQLVNRDIHLNAPKTMSFHENPHSFRGIPHSFYQFVSRKSWDSCLALSVDFDWKDFMVAEIFSFRVGSKKKIIFWKIYHYLKTFVVVVVDVVDWILVCISAWFSIPEGGWGLLPYQPSNPQAYPGLPPSHQIF